MLLANSLRKIFFFLIVFLLLIPFSSSIPKERIVTIGAFFDSTDDSLQISFRHAVERINSEAWFRPQTRFSWQIATLIADDCFAASKKLCSLLKNGAHALIGPQSAKTSSHVQSISKALRIPHVEMREDNRAHKVDSSVNVFPHPATLARVVSATIDKWDWFKTFTIIYETNDGLTRIQELLKLKDYSIHIMQLPHAVDCRPLLKAIKQSGDTKIVIDASVESVATLLQQAKKLGMMTEYYEYVIVNLDMHTLDLKEYRNPVVNITGFQIIDPTQRQFHDILEKFRVSMQGKLQPQNITNPEQNIKTETALLYDAVLLYAHAVTSMEHIDIRPLSCDRFDNAGNQGRELIDRLKSLNITGLTGPIYFNKEGLRTQYNVHVLKNTQTGLKRIYTCYPKSGIFEINPRDWQKEIESSLTQKPLIVSSILNQPFFMLKPNANELQGNHRYEGFVLDMMEAIAKLENITFKIRPVGDSSYGDNRTGKWNGMIGELIERKADVVIADLAITQKRQAEVDFTIPFMSLGISILYKKNVKQLPALFSFLNPFSEEVWIYMATAYLGISVLLFFLARFSAYEWSNPHPCKPNPDVLENTFNLMNSMWFTIGSLMQQGSDLAPKAVSTRLVAGVWWFFTLIMISSYTANLAAFLTSDRMASPIANAEDLSRQLKIKYGCVAGGATMNFFKTSSSPIYGKMWRMMEGADPSVFVLNNDEGVNRVKKGDYAFLMESTLIEYRTVRDCELTQIGSLLDSKGYGVATSRDSPYRAMMNRAVLKLQDEGIILQLKKRWWQEKGGEITCPKDDDPLKTMKLGLANVGGIFVLLTAGMGLACVVGILEFVWNTRKTIREEKVSICTEMAKELKFVLTCSDATKPVVKNTTDPGLAIPLTGYSSAVFGRDPFA